MHLARILLRYLVLDDLNGKNELVSFHSSLIRLHYVLFIKVLMFLTVFKTISFLSIIVLCA